MMSRYRLAALTLAAVAAAAAWHFTRDVRRRLADRRHCDALGAELWPNGTSHLEALYLEPGGEAA